MARSLARRVARLLAIGLAVLLPLGAVLAAMNWDLIQRLFLGGLHVHETSPPALPAHLPRPGILVFSKTNAFRHEEAIPAANAELERLARARGWGYFATENGATFSPQILARFDASVFNNVTGDVFSPAQQRALRQYIEGGGGFVGIHAAGDNSHTWKWYVDKVIGAHFIGHPLDPQFQRATVVTEASSHPAVRGLPRRWARTDEWYSFAHSPRTAGVHVVATLDETTYSPGSFFGKELSMGGDHPIAWWRCAGWGRVFYTAMGHTAKSYSEPEVRSMIEGATAWAIGDGEPDCPDSPPRSKSRYAFAETTTRNAALDFIRANLR